VVCVVASDEDRALASVASLAEEVSAGRPPVRWTCASGLEDGDAASRDPAEALRRVVAAPGPGVWVFLDLEPHLDRPDVQRRLRDVVRAFEAGPPRRLVLLGSSGGPAPPLADEIGWVEQPPPSEAETRDLVEAMGPVELIGNEELLAAFRGVPLHRLRRALGRAGADSAPLATAFAEAHAEKGRLARAAGVLELVEPVFGVDDIGGLERLKTWLVERKGLLTGGGPPGVPSPRGVLLMGVSGCGKSMAAKVTASLWGVPLFRLDMNLVFSGLHGSPEAAFDRALRALERLAPAVCWVDEIENGLGISGAEMGATTNHLFSTFLTWLQEKPNQVFVAATANRIEALPPELIRKGRFDQVFFLDLPNAEERRRIFEVHLRRRGVEPGAFDLDYLVVDTRGWSGAEIEQAVASAQVRAAAAGRPFGSEDVVSATQGMVPLSRTMHEQIRALREWTFGRAIRASEGDSPAAPSQG
jgi:hypothetical protein